MDENPVPTKTNPMGVKGAGEAGNDEAHPYPISEELSKLIPNCEFIPEWKTGAALTASKAGVAAFLAKHTPSRP